MCVGYGDREQRFHLKPRIMTLHFQALEAGYFMVDCGTTATKIGNPRYILRRAADQAVFHYATAKQVRDCLAGKY